MSIKSENISQDLINSLVKILTKDGRYGDKEKVYKKAITVAKRMEEISLKYSNISSY